MDIANSFLTERTQPANLTSQGMMGGGFKYRVAWPVIQSLMSWLIPPFMAFRSQRLLTTCDIGVFDSIKGVLCIHMCATMAE